MSDKLAKIESGAIVQAQDAPSVGQMLAAVIEKGITSENVGALKELVGLYKDMEKWNAEKEFARAFNALQKEMPQITATSVIPNRGKYERFEDLMKVVGPLLASHGFTVSFTMDYKENRILETCHLKHVGGHTQSNSFAVRSGKADTDTQADCKAATTAKRNALCNALNIVIRQDILNGEHDANIEGGVITAEQAFELERRVGETNSNRERFFKLAGVQQYKDIPAAKYSILDELLAEKERRPR